MFSEAGGQHHRAHFHAYYQQHVAVFAIDTLECLGGELPTPQRRLVEAWAEIHREELQRDWELLQSGQPPVKIEPLRSSMSHAIHRVTEFEVVGPYTLSVSFADGTSQVIDFEPVLHGALFRPLRDLDQFNAVRLDTEVGTLVWPNGADFDPATLHDWPLVGAEFARHAAEWDTAATRR
jgi:hypothetical protein